MRVLIAGVRFEDSFAENVALALEELGHEVTVTLEQGHAAYWSLARRVARDIEERIFRGRPQRTDVAVLARVRETSSQLVLCLTGDIHPEVLHKIGPHARRALWWGDAPANSGRWGLLNPEWDWVFCKDEFAVTKLRTAGINAHLLDEAMTPRWHRPVAEQRNDHIAIVGNYYPYRQALAMRLIKHGDDVDLFGSPPPSWAHSEIRRRHLGKYVVREEKSRVFGEALAVLNSTHMSEGNSLNCRAFEIAGAGGLQLIEYRPAISRCFDADKELLTYASWEELCEHVARAKRDPLAMRKIRDAAAKRALAEHTYRHRVECMLDCMRKN
jgi:spore maturation protein CgeB